MDQSAPTNSTPLPTPLMTPITLPGTPQPPQKSSPNYTVMGLIVGVIIALAIIGGIYYKNLLESITPQNYLKQGKAAPTPVIQQKTTAEGPTITPEPSVTPVTVTSPADLTTQQNALDNTDMSSISSGLDQNAKDAAPFAQ